MFFKTGVSAGLVAAVAAIPAPQAATTASPSASASGTSSPFGFYTYNQSPSVDTAAVASVTSVAGLPASAIPGALDPVFPRVSSDVTGVTSHGPYSGTPTTTGALETVILGSTIPALPPNPTATYIANGLL